MAGGSCKLYAIPRPYESINLLVLEPVEERNCEYEGYAQRHNSRIWFAIGVILTAVFCGCTGAVIMVDVQSIGPEGSNVGLATFNAGVFALAFNAQLARAFDVMSDGVACLAALLVVACIVLALVQWARRGGFSLIDGNLRSMLMLYALLALAYVGFELLDINGRPVLVDGALEASFPSSHVLFATCAFVSAAFVLHDRCPHAALRIGGYAVIVLLVVLMVVGRVASGMHWATDVVGSLLLAAALISFYRALCWKLGPVLRCEDDVTKRARHARH